MCLTQTCARGYLKFCSVSDKPGKSWKASGVLDSLGRHHVSETSMARGFLKVCSVPEKPEKSWRASSVLDSLGRRHVFETHGS